jgi:saccharopine dehydrogenase-like NADP-dependent oxidoreductase
MTKKEREMKSNNVKIGILGAGKIGTAIYHLLVDGNICKDVYVADILSFKDSTSEIKKEHYVRLEISSDLEFNEKISIYSDFLKDKTLVINALPYTENINLFQACYEAKVPYFDLSEDKHGLDDILSGSDLDKDYDDGAGAASTGIPWDAGKAFTMPHCGLAPGMSTIIASNLVKEFSKLEDIKIRVGALSTNSTNKLKYHSSWSPEGLVNEYAGVCDTIEWGSKTDQKALTGYERLTLDEKEYEAFNTKGGIGTLIDTLGNILYANELNDVNYKTLRNVGHHDYATFLFEDLVLGEEVLVDIFKNSIPRTSDDYVIVYVEVKEKDKEIRHYYNKFLPAKINGRKYTAIEATTAIGLISVVELYLKGRLVSPDKIQRFNHDDLHHLDGTWTEGCTLRHNFDSTNYYRQEWVNWDDIINHTTYGWYYHSPDTCNSYESKATVALGETVSKTKEKEQFAQRKQQPKVKAEGERI